MKRKKRGPLIILILTLVMLFFILRGCLLDKPKVLIEEGGTMIRIWHHDRRQVETMNLENYLIGVLAAEMPANFELEALKAQAISARTYSLKKMQIAENTPNQAHPEGDVCTDPMHCQAWLSDIQQRERWGAIKYYQYHNKLKRAVEQTSGRVLVYDGRLIDPVYHSTCGGRTENAQDVWNYGVPYLQSVDCPWDKDSPRWQDQIRLSLSDLENRLQIRISTLAVKPTAKRELIRITQQTPTGRAKSVLVGDKSFAATELRNRLGLRSTWFTIEQWGSEFIFKTIGNGHGVGMCQYGANGMAKEGKDCRTILEHYYQGANIVQLK